MPQHKGIKPVLSPSPKSVITSITSAVSSSLAKDSMSVDHVGGTSHMSSVSSKDIAQRPRPFLNHEFWVDNYLPICTDKIYGDGLCNQILYGLPIGFTCEQYYVISKNWPSSNKCYAEVNEFMETGLSQGRSRVPTLHSIQTLSLLPLVPSRGIVATRSNPYMISVGPQNCPQTTA